MKNLTYLLSIFALGVVVFASLKVFGGGLMFSWGILVCAIAFMVTLVVFLSKLAKRDA